MDQQGMKRALRMHLSFYKINLEITDLNPTLESWTGDYIDAMETIRKGKKQHKLQNPKTEYKNSISFCLSM